MLGAEWSHKSIIHRREEIMHILEVEQGHKGVSRCHLQKRRDNAHSGDRTGPQEHQQSIINRREDTIYMLGAEWGHESISRASSADDTHPGGRMRP